MFKRKSQAAMEFIMTYGWAILVVLVAIGALAYFGVLSPDRFLPSRCTLQSGIACMDHKVEPSTITVVLQNALGFDLSQVNASAGACGESGAGVGMANGAQLTFTITCGTPLTGSKYNNDLNVSYIVTDTSLQHKNIGVLTTRIE